MNNEKNKELADYLRCLCRNNINAPWDTIHITMLNNRLNYLSGAIENSFQCDEKTILYRHGSREQICEKLEGSFRG